jgi:hypothetical protein
MTEHPVSSPEADCFTQFSLGGRNTITAGELTMMLAGHDPCAPWWGIPDYKQFLRAFHEASAEREIWENLERDIQNGLIRPLRVKLSNRLGHVIKIEEADAFARRMGGIEYERWAKSWVERKRQVGAVEPEATSASTKTASAVAALAKLVDSPVITVEDAMQMAVKQYGKPGQAMKWQTFQGHVCEIGGVPGYTYGWGIRTLQKLWRDMKQVAKVAKD